MFVSFCVILLSVIPIPEETPLSDVPLIDKWVHFVLYGGLSLAVWFDCSHREKGLSAKIKTKLWHLDVSSLLLTTLYPALLGGGLELVQAYLTTYRSGDWLDFVTDCIGVVLAFPIGISYFLWRQKFGKRNELGRTE